MQSPAGGRAYSYSVPARRADGGRRAPRAGTIECSIMKTLVLTALAAGCLILPVPGMAAPAASADITLASRPVSLADLDLTSAAGHAEAVHRLTRAAYDICRERPTEGVAVHWDWLEYKICVRNAAVAAAAQLPPVAR
jgi:UrcA family protein